MKRLKVVFALAVMTGLLSFADAREADAGRFRIFRGRAATGPAYRVQTTLRNWTPTRARAATNHANGPRIKGRHDWPGAIGNPSPRYQFFQDINGYWK